MNKVLSTLIPVFSIFALSCVGQAPAATLMLDFGPTTPTGANLTNSPLHAATGGSFTDTTWNVLGQSDVGSGLLYSDGGAATGIALNLGVSPTSTVHLATQPGSINALGSTVKTGVYAGDSVAKDAIYQTYSGPQTPAGLNQSYVGAQVTGLEAGFYNVYITGRNTNTTNVASLGGASPYSFDTYIGGGAAGNFDALAYPTANVYFDYGGGTDAWVAEGNPEENYVRMTTKLLSGQALNVAITGNLDGPNTTDHRGFLSMLQIDAITPLVALVHPGTGHVVLSNPSFGASESITFEAYQIHSDAGALQPGDVNWTSLEDQDIGDGPGDGESWNEFDGSNANTVGETFLLGSTTMNPGDTLHLGTLYNVGIGDENLQLTYLDSESGTLKPGYVEFIVPGDMDGNGTLDESDVNPFVEALTNRASFETNYPGVVADLNGDMDGNGQLDLGDVKLFKAALAVPPAAASAVPEPAGLALVLLGLAGLLMRQR